jgi:hypothetical protein
MLEMFKLMLIFLPDMFDFRNLLLLEEFSWDNLGVHLGKIAEQAMQKQGFSRGGLIDLIMRDQARYDVDLGYFMQETALFKPPLFEEYLSGRANFGAFFPILAWYLKIRPEDVFREPDQEDKDCFKAHNIDKRGYEGKPYRYESPLYYEDSLVYGRELPFECVLSRAMGDLFIYLSTLTVESRLGSLKMAPGKVLREYFRERILLSAARGKTDEVTYLTLPKGDLESLGIRALREFEEWGLNQHHDMLMADFIESIIDGTFSSDRLDGTRTVIGPYSYEKQFGNHLTRLGSVFDLRFDFYQPPSEAESEEILFRWKVYAGGIFNPGVHLTEFYGGPAVRPSVDQAHDINMGIIPYTVLWDGLPRILYDE